MGRTQEQRPPSRCHTPRRIPAGMARPEVRDVAAEAASPAGRADRALFDGASAASPTGVGAVGGEPAGLAGRRVTAGACACPARSGSGAGVLPQADGACGFAGEAAVPACIADWFRAGSASPAGRSSCFGAEVRSAPAVRLPAERRTRRGGRAGSCRSSPSLTSRPTSCPSVMRGSTCDSSPLSCSRPRWRSVSMTALSSQRSASSGRSRSAGAARLGSTPASIRMTSRELLPTASSTSAFRAERSNSGGGAVAGVGPLGCIPSPAATTAFGAGPALVARTALVARPALRVARVRFRSRRSKADCNCAAASSVSEPSRSRSRVPATCAHSFMAPIRR